MLGNHTIFRISGTILIVLANGCTPITDATNPASDEQTVAGVLSTRGDLSTLQTALEEGGLTETLAGSEEYTLFAPVNAAFDALPEGSLEALFEAGNQTLLDGLLGLHIVRGKLTAADFRDGQSVETIGGRRLSISVTGGMVSVNGIPLQTTDIEAANGIIHTVPSVFTSALTAAQFLRIVPALTDFVSLLDDSGQMTSLNGSSLVTVFAPTNAAYSGVDPIVRGNLTSPLNGEILEKVVKYHLIEGRYLTSDMRENDQLWTRQGATVKISVRFGRRVNEHNMVTTDVRVSNGVIHVIDGVLLEHLNLFDRLTLKGMGGFLGAVERANDPGLVSALKNGLVTVFAPTDEAFAGSVWSNATPAELGKLIRNHMILGNLSHAGLTDGRKLVTLHGDTLNVAKTATVRIRSGSGEGQWIDQVGAKNGILHSIDGLLPPAS